MGTEMSYSDSQADFVLVTTLISSRQDLLNNIGIS